MYEYLAKVEQVIDGDTVELTVDMGFRLYHRVRARLHGINAPELHKRAQIEKGRLSKQALHDKVVGREVIVRTRKADDFGRWLVIIYVDGTMTKTVNERMIDNGYAIPMLDA